MSDRHYFFLPFALLWCIGFSVVAQAKTTTLLRQGGWEAFGGTDDSGAQVCGSINVEDADRVFVIKRYSGNRDLIVQIFMSTWRISEQRMAINMRFDFYPPWEAEALPVPPDGVRFRISDELAEAFVREFASARVLRIFFSGGDQPWELSLAGGTSVSRAMIECARKFEGSPTNRR